MNQIAVIAGPTGSGESTITNEIARRFPDHVVRLVTATTRTPRDNEISGVDYYFFTKDEFAAHVKDGSILESTYIANRDVYYGTYIPDLQKKIDSGKAIIINPDIVGARYYKEHYGATTIFIVPTNIDELEHRIRSRSPGVSEAEIAKRRDNAAKEIREEQSFYDFTVVNADGKLQEAVGEVVEILKKEGYELG